MSAPADSGALSPSSISSYDYFSATSHGGGSALSASYGILSEDLDSDDEIVWSVSDISSSMVLQSQPRSPAALSDDYILLSRPSSPRALLDGLSIAVASMTISRPSMSIPAARGAKGLKTLTPNVPKRKRSKKKVVAQPVAAIKKAKPTAAPNPSTPKPSAPSSQPKKGDSTTLKSPAEAKASKTVGAKATPSKAKASKTADVKATPSKKASAAQVPSLKKAKRKAAKAAAEKKAAGQPPADPGLGERPVVNDVSEAGDCSVSTPAYRDAVQYISSFLSSSASSAQSASISLKFLQALIVELGLCPTAFTSADTTLSFYSLPSLPHSIRAAKTLLKTCVFLNVRDYLAVRERGLDALRAVMHPSRSSLMREVRNGRRVPVKKVKSIGLSVLLVTCH
ncbi:hypothetical protein CERSUDRAFT_113763 [Gelatoporia subvermispora B]|uniref:Uncharacterized protein n=1 Tax=Ceriporiopsis subvermispora (strain B) TaxID=914234 RepID=M2QNF6_CERS8|nr:hypothetical protein CERSUDRAFT_113763 [Gelatoporia subvermispora B]